jgi:hypothetical protein
MGAIDRRIEEKFNQLGSNIGSLVGDVKKLSDSVRREQENIKDLQEDRTCIMQRLDKLEQAVETSEKEAVRCNLKFFGVPESPRFKSSLVDQMVQLLNDYSVPDRSYGRGWDKSDIERAFRVSSDTRNGNSSRPVIVRFKQFEDKMDILRDSDLREAMREDNIRVTSDLTSHQRNILDFHKSQGKVAYYVGGRLHVSEQQQVQNTRREEHDSQRQWAPRQEPFRFGERQRTWQGSYSRRDVIRTQGDRLYVRVRDRSPPSRRGRPPVVPGEFRYSEVVSGKRTTDKKKTLYRRVEEVNRNVNRACSPHDSGSEDNEPMCPGLFPPRQTSGRIPQDRGRSVGANSTYTVGPSPSAGEERERDADDEGEPAASDEEEHAASDEAGSEGDTDVTDVGHSQADGRQEALPPPPQIRDAPPSGNEEGAVGGAPVAVPEGQPSPRRAGAADKQRATTEASAGDGAGRAEAGVSAAAESRPRTRSASARRANDPGGKIASDPGAGAGQRTRGQTSIKDAFRAQSGDNTASRNSDLAAQEAAAAADK